MRGPTDSVDWKMMKDRSDLRIIILKQSSSGQEDEDINKVVVWGGGRINDKKFCELRSVSTMTRALRFGIVVSVAHV